MAWVKGMKDVVTIICCGCKQEICFQKYDMKHYRHDVDGNNVYVECPSCYKRIDFYKEAVSNGWVKE